MFVARTMLLNEADLLVDIAFYAAAKRGIKLRQIANLQKITVRTR